MPDVSVIIPTFDRWRFLKRTLRGPLGQRGVDLEVLVVDGSPGDECERGIAALRDDRIRLLRPLPDRGVAWARNTGIAEARGRWIAFLDDDDVWAYDKLALQLAAATSANAIFAYGAALVLDERLAVIAREDPPAPEALPSLLRRYDAIPGSASMVLVSAAALAALGGFDESLRHFADWDLWLRLAAAGPGACCPEPLVGYVRHAEAMSAAQLDTTHEEWTRFTAKHDGRLDVDDLLMSRWRASGNRRAGRRLLAARQYARAALRHRHLSDAARAAGALLGDRATARGRAWTSARVSEPEWLSAYRTS
jgi:glycosyltransferase involved in cell wall biosynthesis